MEKFDVINDVDDSEMPFDNCIDADTPLNAALSAKFKRSSAFPNMKDKLPVIITQIIDLLSRDKEKMVKEYGKGAQEELKTVIGRLSKLKNELQTNKPLVLLQSKASDIVVWNNFLKKWRDDEGEEPRWFDSPWLGVECYMYRRIREAFELTTSLTEFDPFEEKKQTAFRNSCTAIEVLAQYVSELLQSKNCSDLRKEFLKLLYVDLWGNRCDLSLSAGKQLVIEADPLQSIENLNAFILVNESEKLWITLNDSKGKSDVIVDIIMDNAGYELFTDLCLADFILTFSLASKIRLRVKTMPWYVSDTILGDIHWTLQELLKSQNPYTSGLAKRWSQYIDSGKWVLSGDEFWTFPHDYSQMSTVDPNLYKDLSKAILVIFKGDLNYRKLVCDINWETTKPFPEALCGFLPTNVATLRTLKADTICGLLPGQADTAAAKHSDWLLSGQYAVIQFSSL